MDDYIPQNKGFQKSHGFQQSKPSTNNQPQQFLPSTMPLGNYQPIGQNTFFQMQDPSFQIQGMGNVFGNLDMSLQQNIAKNQEMFAQKANSTNNLLDALKEKADETTNEGIKTKSNNAKNTYIKKISSITKGSNDYLANLEANDPQKATEKKGLKKNKSGLIAQTSSNEQLNDQDNPNDKDQQKLARNRESARNSRKRKKIYLELLENKVIQLQAFLQESKNICNSCEGLLMDLQNQMRQKNEVAASREILFRNLSNSLEGNVSENNIAGIVESWKSKFGTVNSDRLNMINYFFKQIGDQILPIHMQYILYAVAEGKDIFAPEAEINEQKESKPGELPNILQSLNLSEHQKAQTRKLQKKLLKEKQKMEQIISQLDESKNEVIEELHSLDGTLEQLRKHYQPSQISKFVMQIERSLYKDSMKQAFQKFFSQENILDTLANLGQSDDENQLDANQSDLYDFINQEEFNQTLLVDINSAYDIYADSYDFLQKKKKFQKEEK